MLACIFGTMAMPQHNVYQEPHRPQFHFTAKAGWLNDPNGLVFAIGEYHLFFQHNPFGTQWGNMTWGHAVSKDLIHWKQVDDAILPGPLGTVFSGSAVADHANTAGFGKGAIVCIYTAAGGTNEASKGKSFTQCLAYSRDGRTFSEYLGNPVLPHVRAENRDPKVVWHELTKQWVMALYLDGSTYALYGSPNLKSWTHLSTLELPNASECPDFFEIALDGKSKKWVFWGASGHYQVGTFDGKTFHPETGSIPSNFGNTAYAAQTYFDAPKNRRIQIAWFRGSEFPGMPWNQQMGFPTDLTLRTTPNGPRLFFQPVGEIRSLRQGRLKASSAGDFAPASALLDASFRIQVGAGGRFSVEVNGQKIAYDGTARLLSAGGKEATLSGADGQIDLRILADRSSIEVFAQGGLVSMPLFVKPDTVRPGLSVHVEGDASLKTNEVYELKSAWRG